MLSKVQVSCFLRLRITYSIWTAQVIGVFKAKAERVEIPYQTLLNSIVKRYTESMLDIKTI